MAMDVKYEGCFAKKKNQHIVGKKLIKKKIFVEEKNFRKYVKESQYLFSTY